MEYYIDLNKKSPFEPLNPASPENFKGRTKTIKKVLRYVNEIEKGNTQHFFLTGPRGSGKTSLVTFIQYYLQTNNNMIGVYINSKNIYSLENFAISIIEGLANNMKHDSLRSRVKYIFNKIKKVLKYNIEIDDAKISFKNDKVTHEELLTNFPYYLHKVIDDLFKEHKGIILVIDDVNGFAESQEFIDWYKSLADTISVDEYFKIPLYIIMTGYSETFEKLVYTDKSFGRLFHHEEIGILDEGIKEFYIDSFKKANMTIDDDALDIISYYSFGLPLMMQQIGDSIYWYADDDKITKEEAIHGIITAASEIRNKQLTPIINQIESEDYKHILLRLGELEAYQFKVSEIKEKLNKEYQIIFEDFIEYMVKLNILKKIGKDNSDEYEFNNITLFVYTLIKTKLKIEEE
ncbi:MAG: ATP-binding protein [Methanobacteriaceae archaeon]|nr:ATP-binding protein [Methanobacteriaceae archaeon]